MFYHEVYVFKVEEAIINENLRKPTYFRGKNIGMKLTKKVSNVTKLLPNQN